MQRSLLTLIFIFPCLLIYGAVVNEAISNAGGVAEISGGNIGGGSVSGSSGTGSSDVSGNTPVDMVDTPANIAGNLELWFDGDDNDGGFDGPTGDTTSGGITTWVDKSSNGYDADGTGHAPDYSSSSQNSLACVNYDGSTEWSDIGDHDDLDCMVGCTIAFVAKTASSLSHGRIISKQNTSGSSSWGVAFPSFTAGNNDITFAIWGDSMNSASWHGRTDTDSITTSTTYVVMASYNGGTAGPTDLTVDLDGVLDVDDSTNNTGSSFPPGNTVDAVRLGARNSTPANFFSGDICEIVMYSDELTGLEKGDLFTYFNDKWVVY